MDERIYMEAALELAKEAFSEGEVPVGCVIVRNGEIVGKYFKEHLVESEVSVMELDSDYSVEYSEPAVIEMEGISFGFLTCYDFYFYEAFPTLARKNIDVIIGCSHQRTDWRFPE